MMSVSHRPALKVAVIGGSITGCTSAIELSRLGCEVALFERFRALAKDRTAIIISHRFSTVRMADRIAVLEGGRLTELGSHVQLLELGGRYARLFALQAQGYR